MSHNINEEKVFVVGQPAWHGIGKVVKEAVTAKEAIKLADLDYKVILKRMFHEGAGKVFFEHTDNKFIVREDTQNVLGIATEKYQIIQNVEAFNFFDVLVGEGQAIYHTAGALGKGERIWILAKLPKDIIINKDDIVEQYLCLTASHDGKSSVKLYHTPVRVVCQNTLNMSMNDAKKGISIKHSGDIKDKTKEARKILGISVNYYQQFESIVKIFEEKTLDVNATKQYFENVLDIEDDKEVSTRKTNKLEELHQLFEEGQGQKLGNKHSVWKAYNAVTEYVDHYSSIKNLEEDQTNKLKNVWFGTGSKLKEKAYNEALALVS